MINRVSIEIVFPKGL